MPAYGIINDEVKCTNCTFADSVIPFEPLWQQYKRIRKPSEPVVLFCIELFTDDSKQILPSAPKQMNLFNF